MGKREKFLVFVLLLIASLLAVTNLLGVFVPEIGFDALWYHLSLPKLWLLKQQYYFPGGLLYYSVMPRLTEWIFTPLIYITGTIGPKLVQFIAALVVASLTYKLARRFKLSLALSIAAACAYYCSFLVSWQSSSAYIDLFRSALEIGAFWFLIQKRNLLGGVLLGLALGTKWLSLFSVFIYLLVFGVGFLPATILVSLPWFLVAYFYTSNPVFPLFSSMLQNGFQNFAGIMENIALSPFKMTFPFDDFISPLAGVFFALSAVGIILLTGDKRRMAYVAVLGGLGTLVLDPPSARFFLPYYPLAILASLFLVENLSASFKRAFLGLLVVSCLLVFGLRIFTFTKNIDYLLGKQTREQYLESLAHKLPDTFVDTDLFITNNLRGKKILIDKLHNLYYFPYDFDHTSWATDLGSYNYLVTKNQNPTEINAKLLHTNSMGIQVFEFYK